MIVLHVTSIVELLKTSPRPSGTATGGQMKIRLSQVFNKEVSTAQPLLERDILIACAKCGPIGADKCIVRRGRNTKYLCRGCAATLVIVEKDDPLAMPWPGRGQRLSGFVVRNAVPLYLHGRIVIPPSPNALAVQRRSR